MSEFEKPRVSNDDEHQGSLGTQLSNTPTNTKKPNNCDNVVESFKPFLHECLVSVNDGIKILVTFDTS